MSVFVKYRKRALSLIVATAAPLVVLSSSFAIDGVPTPGADRLIGTKQADTINGGEGDDDIRGGGGDDMLEGGPGDDMLNGHSGDDILIGGPGSDTLTGEPGADTFRYLELGDSTTAAAGRDTITDFTRGDGDIIDLSAIDANSVEPGDQAFVFIGNEPFNGIAGELRYRREDGKTYLSADVNGDKQPDILIEFPVKRTFIPADFKL